MNIEAKEVKMPANLSPEYFDAEKRLKTATTPEEKLSILEEMLSVIPKHKGTEKLQAQLKTRISKLKSSSQKKTATAKHTHKIRKSGAGQVVIIGPANAGKSMLVKALTDANPQVSDYPFTTVTAYPAMMKYENIQVQLVDTPPITPGYMEVWYPDLIKAADGVLILIDPSAIDPDPYDAFQCLLERLKEKKIQFVKAEQAPSSVFEPGSGWSYKKTLMIANKCDLPHAAENLEILKELLESDFEWIPISAHTGDGLENLRKRIFLMLGVIRIYSKIPGKKAEFDSPFTLKKGSTVMDMARAVHQDFAQKLKFARIWSKNKYDGQRVNRDCILEDEDIIELHI
ncbi:MAG: 50S ribosome-binding GTPase [Candidatus Aminicenantes bacterium]|nr:MAG: 50S ribosome-binding GTPase [Candidatus Aminicenantes bacterium]